MAVTRVTRKGQITLPEEIREALNLKTGNRVNMTVEGKEEVYGIKKKDVNFVLTFDKKAAFRLKLLKLPDYNFI